MKVFVKRLVGAFSLLLMAAAWLHFFAIFLRAVTENNWQYLNFFKIIDVQFFIPSFPYNTITLGVGFVIMTGFMIAAYFKLARRGF